MQPKSMGALTATLVVVTTVLAAQVSGQETVERREVTFSNGDVTLAGTVLLPSRDEPVPGVVIIHGSGDSDRGNAWTSAWADALASRGIAVLHPDKRGCGASEGDWRIADFPTLAGDAVAAVTALGDLEQVDASRVGVLGFSQGGYVAPLAAASSDRVRFAGAVSGSVVSMVQQIVDEVELAAERAGFTAEQVARVTALHRLAIHYGMTGVGWEAYATARQAALDSDLAPVVEPFPDTPDHWIWRWGRVVGDVDPLPYWVTADVPELFVFGGQDERIRVGRSVDLITRKLVAGGANATLAVFAPNGHGIYRADAVDLVARWVTDGGAS
jgi:pimeloyl-ACP methyl ester carboxylesterase